MSRTTPLSSFMLYGRSRQDLPTLKQDCCLEVLAQRQNDGGAYPVFQAGAHHLLKLCSAMALKALDQRLQNANASSSSSAPAQAPASVPNGEETAPTKQGEDNGKGKGKAVEPAES